MSGIIDIAQDVVDELNAAPAGTFSQAFTATRAYLPQFELKDMADLHVTVVPKGATVELFDRNSGQHDYSIDLAVQKKLDNTDPSQIDPLIKLVEEIADFFGLRRLTACADAMWVKTEYAHLYAQEHMQTLGQFTSVLTLTFRVVR